MSDEQQDDWSPAHNPYAIAVSQSWWALQALLLFASQARNAFGHDQRIYSRQIFGQLRLLRLCAQMQAKELKRLRVSDVNRDHLNRAIESFDGRPPAPSPPGTSSSTLTSTRVARADSSRKLSMSLGSAWTKRQRCIGEVGMTPPQNR
jgi:hypothetical protein